jgi:hypothetical protein
MLPMLKDFLNLLIRNKLVVIDWKTSQKQKSTISMTYDTPVQIAAYIGAINSDPNFSLKVNLSIIIIIFLKTFRLWQKNKDARSLIKYL